MRDWMALQMIRLARRLTTWGDVDDVLGRAGLMQHWAVSGQCRHVGHSRCDKCRI